MPPGDNRGFTLIEVLVALVIALLAIAALAGGISSSLRAAHQTARWDRAVSRAQSHLDSILDPATLLGERQGDEADGYHWRTEVAFERSAPAPNSQRGGIWARGTGLYAITVLISWNDGAQPHRFELRSARLGPVPSASP